MRQLREDRVRVETFQRARELFLRDQAEAETVTARRPYDPFWLGVLVGALASGGAGMVAVLLQ